MAGADGEAFERRCIREVLAAKELPGPRELTQALCFRDVVERGERSRFACLGAIDYAVANDAAKPLRAAFAKMRPRETKTMTERLEEALAHEAKYASMACAPPVSITLDDAEPRELGSFMVESDLLRIGDPCRGPYHVALDRRHEAANGAWRARAYVSANAGQRDRCRLLLAHHEAHELDLSDTRWHSGSTIAVDAGMAGVFDAYHFADDEPVDPSEARDGHTAWYSLCMRRCLNESTPAGIVPFGVVANSGGDGIYDVWYAYHANDKRLHERVVGVCVVFEAARHS
jgi:hypothetical protein